MRKIIGIVALSLVVAVLVVSCGKKNNYSITGTLPSEVKAERVYLYTVANNTPVLLDSAKVKNGQFKMKGVAADTVGIALLMLQSDVHELKDLAAFWSLLIEPGEIVVDSNSLFAHGTPLNDFVKEGMSAIMSGSGEDPAEFLINHWSEHSSDFAGPYMLMLLSPGMDFALVDSLAHQIPDNLIQQYTMLRSFKQQVEAIRNMQPGSKFTDVTVADLNGAAVKFSDFIGKGDYVLVDFWASWCRPCREAMPELQEVAKKFKKLKVVGIAISDELAETKQAMEDLKITWTVLSDHEGLSARTYGVNTIPSVILFAPDGTIVARDFPFSELDTLIK